MDVIEELKFLENSQDKMFRGGSVWGVRVGGGQGGCERRIELFCEKSKKKLGGSGGGGGGIGLRGGSGWM